MQYAPQRWKRVLVFRNTPTQHISSTNKIAPKDLSILILFLFLFFFSLFMIKEEEKRKKEKKTLHPMAMRAKRNAHACLVWTLHMP